MRRDLPSKYQPKIVTETTTLTTRDLFLCGLVVATTAAVTVTLPSPQAALDGAEALVANGSAGNVTVSCTNGFLNDADTITLAAGASAALYCAQIAGGTFRWCAVGVTPS